MKKLLFLALMTILWHSTLAYDFSAVAPSGQTLFYNFVSGGVEVTYPNYVEYEEEFEVFVSYYYNYIKPLGNLTIPDSVSYNGNTYPVIAIGDHAFYECTGLTSLTIPNSISSMGTRAFFGCNNIDLVNYNAVNCSYSSLDRPCNICCDSVPFGAFIGCHASVVIGNSVQVIPSYLFFNCDNIMSVTISNSVTSIGKAAFYGCSGLTSLTIPNSVTSIGAWAFSGCSSIDSVYYNAENCSYVLDDVLDGVYLVLNAYLVVLNA